MISSACTLSFAQGLLRLGEVGFHAGETGDNFYVVADGTVQVLDQDRIVRTLATGDGLGEIALMGNTTRTMTVRAVDPVQLYGIGSADFLSAVTSIGDARSAAEATRWTYLAHAPGVPANGDTS